MLLPRCRILLRLPPLPCSLPRAVLVCERWRGIVSCARVLRRFREHHRRSPPLLGCFVEGISPVRFEPTLEGPNRVPQSRFPFPIAALHLRDPRMPSWPHAHLPLAAEPAPGIGPITGDRHHLDVPGV
ncbi:hypothetical protein ZWY2020_005403 [Hordeum vulgare]|nr:hypothetical protein ZWY2020_005403 [Hordeum vulgare]